MRVLWFTNTPAPALADEAGLYLGVGGSWMWALADRLVHRKDLTLGIATAVPANKDSRIERSGTTYYLMAQPKRQHFRLHTSADLRRATEVVRDFRPDIIHIHGTERFYGLLSAMIDPSIPIVISIQGLLSRCRPHWLADLTWREALSTVRLRDILRAKGTAFGWATWRPGCDRERAIFRANSHFIGRTEWDRAWVSAFNPTAEYHHCEEMLREPFYSSRRNVGTVIRNSLLFTSSRNPLKGIYTLFDALSILERWNIPFTVNLAGDPPTGHFGRPVRNRLQALGLTDRVSFLGPLSATRLAEVMCQSHLFVCPSHVDNASNSVMEAMTVGLPCVASFVGGITTTLNHGQAGVMVPPGDAAMLASAIRLVLADDHLADSLSSRAREVALDRYDPASIVRQQIDIYKRIIHAAAPSTALSAASL